MKYYALLLALIILLSCGKKPEPVYSADKQYAYAMSLYEKGKYYKAQIAFENLIYSYPGNSVIDTAQYYLGMSYYQQEEYGVAGGEFQKLLSAYPNSAYGDDAQYQLAMCHYQMSPKYQLDQNETYLAIDEFRELIVGYPGTPFRDDALVKIKELENKLAEKAFRAGELYMKMGDYDPALVYFRYVRDNYPATEWAIKSFYYTGEAQEKLKQYKKALETYENFLIVFSSHELADKARKRIEKVAEIINSEES